MHRSFKESRFYYLLKKKKVLLISRGLIQIYIDFQYFFLRDESYCEIVKFQVFFAIVDYIKCFGKYYYRIIPDARVLMCEYVDIRS